jgi:hypothetical protein
MKPWMQPEPSLMLMLTESFKYDKIPVTEKGLGAGD